MTSLEDEVGMRSFVWTMMVCSLSMMVLVTPAVAQDGKAQEDDLGRQSQIVQTLDDKSKVTIPKPDGWVVARHTKGSLALFRDAGDKTSQLEVKYTPGISAEQQLRYFQTFHTSLKKMGFVELPEADRTFKPGVIKGFNEIQGVEYTIVSQGANYRMIVWQAHRGTGAWMVVGFFPEAARDVHVKSIELLVTSMTFS